MNTVLFHLKCMNSIYIQWETQIRCNRDMIDIDKAMMHCIIKHKINNYNKAMMHCIIMMYPVYENPKS